MLPCSIQGQAEANVFAGSSVPLDDMFPEKALQDGRAVRQFKAVWLTCLRTPTQYQLPATVEVEQLDLSRWILWQMRTHLPKPRSFESVNVPANGRLHQAAATRIG